MRSGPRHQGGERARGRAEAHEAGGTERSSPARRPRRTWGEHTTVGTPDNAEIAKSLGADKAILYRQQSVAQYVGELTNGRGYDVVFDTVGGGNIASSIEALATNGRCATTVSLGAQPDLSGLHTKNASLHVVFMLLPMVTGEGLERHGTIMERVSALADHGRIKPLLDGTRFTLAEINAAHERLTSGRPTGKVVIDVN